MHRPSRPRASPALLKAAAAMFAPIGSTTFPSKEKRPRDGQIATGEIGNKMHHQSNAATPAVQAEPIVDTAAPDASSRRAERSPRVTP